MRSASRCFLLKKHLLLIRYVASMKSNLRPLSNPFFNPSYNNTSKGRKIVYELIRISNLCLLLEVDDMLKFLFGFLLFTHMPRTLSKPMTYSVR